MTKKLVSVAPGALVGSGASSRGAPKGDGESGDGDPGDGETGDGESWTPNEVTS